MHAPKAKEVRYNMSDNLDDFLSDAAKLPETETLKTDAILNREFSILDARSVETQFGTSWVGTIDLDGTVVEAWLNGAVVGRQLTSLVEAGKLPVTVKMIRDEEEYGNPFKLVA
tara:strand:+ start:41 stop:382 length:342 start_codon:yes stop_codon:yes gene_type:complete